VNNLSLNIKGLNIGDKEIGEECVVSIEFRPEADEESGLVYLTIELVKEQDGWKVYSYGLER